MKGLQPGVVYSASTELHWARHPENSNRYLSHPVVAECDLLDSLKGPCVVFYGILVFYILCLLVQQDNQARLRIRLYPT